MLQSTPPDMSLTDAIHRRKSCRSFTGQPLTDAQITLLKGIGHVAPRLTPVPVRFAIIEGVKETASLLRGLVGSYGKATGASALLVGIVGFGEHRGESLGFSMEHVILEATRHRIATCWMSGTFNRVRVANELTLARGEQIVAVSPLGIASKSPAGFFQALAGRLVHSTSRKSLSEIVFDGKWGADPGPLLQSRPDLLAMAEAVRAAPSALNQQPWRLVITRSSAVLLSVKANSGLDNGIALAHWAITAQELGLPGVWNLDPDREALNRDIGSPDRTRIVGVFPLQ